MSRLFLGVFLLILGAAYIIGFSDKNVEQKDYALLRAEQDYQEEVSEYEIVKLVNKSSTLKEVQVAEELVKTLPAKSQKDISPVLSLKKALLLFRSAEEYLKRAAEIETAFSGAAEYIPDPENAQPENPQQLLHPLAAEMLKKAFELYEQARKEIELLNDDRDYDYNFSLNYLKGVVYYRYLELFSDKESAPELFNQTLSYFKRALRFKSGDIDTVINIELLIKNQSGMGGNGGANNARKRQVLTSKRYGVSKSTGN